MARGPDRQRGCKHFWSMHQTFNLGNSVRFRGGPPTCAERKHRWRCIRLLTGRGRLKSFALHHGPWRALPIGDGSCLLNGHVVTPRVQVRILRSPPSLHRLTCDGCCQQPATRSEKGAHSMGVGPERVSSVGGWPSGKASDSKSERGGFNSHATCHVHASSNGNDAAPPARRCRFNSGRVVHSLGSSNGRTSVYETENDGSNPSLKAMMSR